MSQSDRDAFLRELGYEEPYQESPVDVPDGWNGGEVVNTGGNIMCRVWRTWETSDPAEETEYEVIYNVAQDETVALQAYMWDEGKANYQFDHLIKTRKADQVDDHSQAAIARDLMLDHP